MDAGPTNRGIFACVLTMHQLHWDIMQTHSKCDSIFVSITLIELNTPLYSECMKYRFSRGYSYSYTHNLTTKFLQARAYLNSSSAQIVFDLKKKKGGFVE